MSDYTIKEAYDAYLEVKEKNTSKNEFGGFQGLMDEMKEKHENEKEYSPNKTKLTDEEINTLLSTLSPSELSD